MYVYIKLFEQTNCKMNTEKDLVGKMDLKVCRICCGTMQLKNISEEDNEIIDKLHICLNINIHSGDLLPKFICEQCELNLDICFRLKKLSESTQERLMLTIQRNQSVSEQVVDGESADEHSDYEKVDLSQCSDDSFENENLDECTSKKDTNQLNSGQQDMNTEFIESVEYVGFGGNNAALNKESETVLKEVSKVSIASEYCSIDLLSSSGSSSSDDTKQQDESKVTDASTFTCDTCQEVFANKQEYRVHIRDHGLERYQCIQCCKFFPSRFRLKRHEETHKDIQHHQCTYCNRNYRALYNLKRHVQSAHLGKKSWECNVCNVSFSREDTLKRHLHLHSDEKKFKCSLCSQSFKTKDYLNAHSKTHNNQDSDVSKANKRAKKDDGDKKNQCGYCGKLFKSSFAFKNHILIHTNEKPHKCETCEKPFRTIAALTIHQRVHDDYRPYQCDLCLKSFRQTSHLNEHKALHTDDAPKHVCSICETSFAKKGNLKAHMLTHAKEKAFKCADCSAEFSFIHLLQRHASKVHSRSVNQVFTLNDVEDDALETDDDTRNNDASQSELYHYIDTVADDNNDDFGENEPNFVDLVTNDNINPKVSSSEQQVISLPDSKLQIVYDKNCDAPDNNSMFNADGVHLLNCMQTKPNISEIFNDHENNTKDQKVDILVTEETKLASSYLNVYRMEDK